MDNLVTSLPYIINSNFTNSCKVQAIMSTQAIMVQHNSQRITAMQFFCSQNIKMRTYSDAVELVY